jgi:hypothetical protein
MPLITSAITIEINVIVAVSKPSPKKKPTRYICQPDCSVIRPSDDRFAGAQAAVAALTADGLFLGQTSKFFEVLQEMAEKADAA